MKKIALVVLVVFSVQSLTAQNVSFGLKGGVNMSKFISPSDPGGEYNMFKYKFGFQVGGFAEIKLKGNFYLQPELLFSLQGTKQINAINRTYYNTNEFYFTLPLMFNYKFLEKYSAELGPQINYLFTIKQEEGGFKYPDDVLDELLNEINWGLAAGVKYDVSATFGFGFRYIYGFDRKEDATTAFLREYKNSVFQLNLEYRFN
ncbi:MAG: porin family protein [Urechidicola sp.]|nr:porin family protein [Urechidicola sp.]